MCRLSYKISKASLKQTVAIALDVYQKTNLQPEWVEFGGQKLNFNKTEALKLLSGAIKDGDFIRAVGYLE